MSAARLEQLASLPQSELAKIPAAPPPDGVIPNFTNPESWVPSIMGASTTFFAIATAFLILRTYVKIRILRKWQIEDTILIFAWLFAVVYFVAGIMQMYCGGVGRHVWDNHLNQSFYNGWFFTFWTTNAFNLTPVGLTKIAILIQYWRLFSTKHWMRIAIVGGIVTQGLFYFSFTVIQMVFTSPLPGETIFDCLVSWRILVAARWVGILGIINTIFDFYILLLPIHAVLKLQMSVAKKIGVLLIFMSGGLACIASIVSVVYRYQINFKDVPWSIGPVLLWVLVEMFVGIIVACAPSVNVFWSRKCKPAWLRSSLFKSSIGRLSSRSRTSTNNEQKLVPSGSKGQGRVVRHQHSTELGDASTFVSERQSYDDLEMGRKESSSFPQQIFVEDTYRVDFADANGSMYGGGGGNSETHVEIPKGQAL